jgi:hypothetical protein
MPRQSDSAENKPGEKAMMRKLAVTVFALSLAAFGCGSDSGTKTTDAPVTPPADGGGKLDTPVPGADVPVPDAPIVDSPALDTAKDVPAVDVAQVLDQAQPVDQAPQTLDTAKVVDVQSIDSTKPVVDGGVNDTKAPVDSGSTVDSGSVDARSAG